MDGLTSAAGVAALAAGVIAIASLASTAVLWRRLKALRAAQTAVLGPGGRGDLVEHSALVERRLERLAEAFEQEQRRAEDRDNLVDERIDGAVSNVAVVRYDAMNEMTGRQSSSMAFLDSHRTGVVLSSILHREQARLYAKPVVRGESAFDLSPEEEKAIADALSSGS